MRANNKSSLERLYVPFFYWSFPITFLYFGLPIYSKTLGASAVEIGGLFSAFTLANIILRPLIGKSLDKKGRKAFLVVGFGLYASAMAAFALADTLGGLYLARIVQGLGAAFLWVTAYTIIADLTRSQERGQALGRLDETTSRGGLLGVFFGLFILTIFPDNLGWRLSFLGYTALMGVGTYLVVRLIPGTRPETSEIVKDKKPLSQDLLVLLIIVFITGASEAMLGPIYLIFLQDRFTTDIPVLALAFLPGVLITAFLASRLGGLSHRFGRVPLLGLGLLGSGILTLLLPNIPSLVWLIILYTIATVAWKITEPAEAGLVADLTGLTIRGRGFGLYEFVGMLGAALGPLIGGILYDRVSQAAPFYLNGVVLLGSVVAVGVALRGRISQVKIQPDRF